MARSLNEQLLDIAILRQIGLERYANTLVRQVQSPLEASQADLAARLRYRLDLESITTGSRGPWTVARLQPILAECERANEDAYGAIFRSYLRPALLVLATHEVAFWLAVLAAVLRGSWVTWNQPTPPALADRVDYLPADRGRGLTLKQEMAGVARRQWAGIAGAVQVGALDGSSPAAILRKVVGTAAVGYVDGEMQEGRDSIELWTRAGVAHSASTARRAFLGANAHALAGIILVPILDSRTSETCRSIGRPGGIARIQPVEGGDYPPFHLRCRTTPVPYVLRGGGPPEDPVPTAWVRRQSPAVQDAILGRARARKLRAGGKITREAFGEAATGGAWSLDQLDGFGLPAMR